jgi:hypothetical protein
VQTWGIAAPGSAPTITDSGVAGNPNGTYESYITYYNTNTDHESSPGPTSTTVTVASKKLNYSWAASADSQVTHVRIYRRNTSTQSFFYRVTEVAIGTTTYSNDTATDASLITKGPDPNQYDPPPTGTKLCEWHYSRMFVSDGVDVFYSEEGKPEAFNPVNTLPGINTNEGEEVTALHSTNGVLLITKRTKTYLLTGDAPENWHIELLDPGIGCVGTRAMLTVNGIARWWSLRGMVEWDGESAIRTPAQILLSPSINPDVLEFSSLNLVVAAEDPTQQRIVFAIPELGKSRNTIYIPYSYRLHVFEADQWQGLDAASLCAVEDSTGIPYLYCGGYKGQVFRVWDGDNDGIAASTTSSGTVTAATAATLTDSTATFDTTGNGLIERYVVAIDPAGSFIQRRRISSNTATVLTLADDWSTTPDTTWTYIVGGPEFAWDTRWNTGDTPFYRKRIRHFYFLLGSTNDDVEVDLSFFFNFRTGANDVVSASITTSDDSAIWDTALWDEATFGAQSASHYKVRVSRKARAWRVRIENRLVDSPVVLHKIGCSSELLTDKNAA